MGFKHEIGLPSIVWIRRPLLAFALMTLLLSSSAGCMGLVPMRETIEWMRGEPKVVDIDEKYNISHTFAAFPSTTYSEVQQFNVTADVSEIVIYVRVSMPDPLDLSKEARELIERWTGQNVTQFSEEVRYVHVTITDGAGDVFYDMMITETIEPVVDVRPPPLAAGIWHLEVDARGYGGNLFDLIEAEDSFAAIVTVTSDCVRYIAPDCIDVES